MPAILTVTFNPCIDVNSSVRVMLPDIKLQCAEPLYQPGGGGINVARAIRQLGGTATTVFLSAGSNGRRLTAMLAADGIPCLPVEVTGNTRENLIIADESTGLQYRFNMPGPAVTAADIQRLLSCVSEQKDVEFIIVSGSLAPGMSPGIWEDLAAIAKEKKARLIADTSGESLKRAMAAGIFLLKPSAHELASLAEQCAGAPSDTLPASGPVPPSGAAPPSVSSPEPAALSASTSLTGIAQMARQAFAAGNCQAMAVSLGKSGVLLVTANGTRQFPAPAVKVVSTVGAGDSLVAGIVRSLQLGKDLEESVQYGAVCGAAATLNPGTTLCRAKDVERLLAGLQEGTCPLIRHDE